MSTTHPTAFGTQLRHYRERAGLTQEALAERAGLTVNAISALERGERRQPYPHTVQALATALGLSVPEHAGLLAARTQRATTPAEPGSSRPPPPTLPALPLTPLIGRSAEVAAIVHVFGRNDVRLVTLLGPGGVGKTRVALEAAAHLAQPFPDGVVWVELAALNDPVLLIPTIAAALDVRPSGARPLHDLLYSALHGKQLLLVLDNLEHLLAAAPDLAALLHACPTLAVLVTSRVALRIRGEHEYIVPPLDVPPLEHVPHLDEVAAAPAVQLFVARAQAVVPDFVLTQSNAATLAAICRRLDGLPLALELAAARVKVLGTTGLLARLDRALPLLTGGARDLPERQQTLRTALGGSYDLLAPDDQALFRRLAVFVGGWTLEAAEALGANVYRDPDTVLDGLARLVDASLVLAGTHDMNTPRYRMLEPIRQYARTLLDEMGEAAAAEQGHVALCLALAVRAEPALRGPHQSEWLQRLEEEHGNMRAAMAWALRNNDGETAARLGWMLHLFWWFHGHQREGQRYMEQVVDRAEALSTHARAQAMCVLGVMLYGQGVATQTMRWFAQSATLFGQIQAAYGEAYAIGGMGVAALEQGDLDTAAQQFERSLTLFQQQHEMWTITQILTYLGLMRWQQGDVAQAAQFHAQARAQAQRAHDTWGVCFATYNLALVEQAQGHHEQAAHLFREGGALAHRLGNDATVAYCLEGLAAVAGTRGERTQAVRLYGTAHALLQAVGEPVFAHVSDRARREQTLADLRAHLGGAAFAVAWAEGRAMRSEQALATPA